MIDPLQSRTGTPPSVGRYLVFTRCASSQISDFVEPTIATWNRDRWNFYDTFHGTHDVIGWQGPIPAARVSSFAAPPSDGYVTTDTAGDPVVAYDL